MTNHDVLDRRVYATDELVFKEGEVGRRCAYLLESGKIEISKRSAEGAQKVLGHIGPGGIFGEMALIDNKPRMAMAKAVEPSVVIIVNEASFEEKLRRADPFIRALLNIFTKNIRETTDKLVNR